MNFFEKFINLISFTTDTPSSYGLFHLISVICVIAITVLLCFLYKNVSSKTFRIFVCVAWLVMVVFEALKQCIFAYDFEGNVVNISYAWEMFPYQLCSTPIYLLPFVVFLKECKFRDWTMSFISTFALFGGLVVFIYPNDVFCKFGLINFQTMIHHGLQIVLGVYFIVYNRKKLNFKYFFGSIIIFAIMVTIAILLNYLIHNFVTTQIFNMFFVSPYFPQHLPILSTIYATTPYIVYLLIYLFGISLAACVVFLIQFGFVKLALKGKQNAID